MSITPGPNLWPILSSRSSDPYFKKATSDGELASTTRVVPWIVTYF
jgi:hypothetical protein